jgi:dTDP-4-amino-4,6-dideoxygalactose transaminase
VNSRLDEMQAAILRARLPRLAHWTTRRRELAGRYRSALRGTPVDVPPAFDAGHVYHLFVVRSRERDALRAHLAARGIETLIHYPVPIPRQPALATTSPSPCPHADALCAELLSLPLSPAIGDAEIDEVAAAVSAFATLRESQGRPELCRGAKGHN